MADTKTSLETAATTLDGTELVPGVQSTADVKITVAQLVTAAVSLGTIIQTLTISSPNASINVATLTPKTGTNVDMAVVVKGTGALLAVIPDSTTTNGNKRGNNAVDWQITRSLATDVAAGNFSTISGGIANQASGFVGVVAGGSSNKNKADYSTITGGYQNIVQGGCSYSGILNGQSNQIGSSTTTTSTHCAIVGGQTNNIGDASDHSAILGGSSNTLSGPYNIIVGGNSQTISSGATGAAMVGGVGNTITGTGSYSTILGGNGVTMNSTYSVGFGRSLDSRNLQGTLVYSSNHFGDAVAGRNQVRLVTLRIITTNATEGELKVDTNSVSNLNTIYLPTAIYCAAFEATITGFRSDGGAASTWVLRGTVRRTATAASTVWADGVTPTAVALEATPPTGWACRVGVDTTTDALRFYVTGVAATTIRWFADIRLKEVAF